MTTAVELPALDGRDPLGFLAALGLTHLLHQHHDPAIRLSFSTTTARAVVHSDLTSTHDVTAALRAIIDRTDDDTAIAGVDNRFPLRRPSQTQTRATGTGDESDPMRVPRDRYPTLVDRVASLGAPASQWLRCLVTDQALDAKGRAALTPYCAPAGKQSLRSFFATPLQAVRKNPDHIHQALTRWRRIDNFSGEYLDHRVIRDAADHPHGKSTETGVPGATWLATQALRLFRLTGDGQRPTATLWHRHDNRPVMIWPLWTPPLNQDAIQALIEHPALTPNPTHPLSVNKTPLQNLNAFTIAAAERRQLRETKSAGVLLPLPITW